VNQPPGSRSFKGDPFIRKGTLAPRIAAMAEKAVRMVNELGGQAATANNLKSIELMGIFSR
jgi:hypothetical protein